MAHDVQLQHALWWQQGVIYQVYPRSSMQPIRPAGEIYNAKPSESPDVGDIHNAKPRGSSIRRVEASSARDAIARSAFWEPASPGDGSHAG
jgi:hypothetical protein